MALLLTCTLLSYAVPFLVDFPGAQQTAMGGAYVGYEPRPASGLLDARSMVPLGANFFAMRRLFAEHGGYDEQLWDRCGKAALGVEDAEMGMRIRARGELTWVTN